MGIIVNPRFEAELAVPAVVIGGGGAGLCAALAARGAGAAALVLERDRVPLGTTAMSTGLIPAAGSRIQRAAGVDDSAERFAADIRTKTTGKTDAALVERLAAESAETVDWLTETHGVALSLVAGFLYPGHSALRMHGLPGRSGAELMGALHAAAERAGVDVLTEARADRLIVDEAGRVLGVEVERPGGAREAIGCGALVLACCGFAGNAAMVREHIPELTHAAFHGHPGAQGDAIRWGEALGAAIADRAAYQGHAGLAAGHAVPILWPLIAEGGIQVNRAGRRFADESRGYSEQAADVLAQPGHVAWSVWDGARHQVMLQFDDYHTALAAGAIMSAATTAALAKAVGIEQSGLAAEVAEQQRLCASGAADRFGRRFAGLAPLGAPFYAARVTGALFHTQGGLEVDGDARVLRRDGTPFPNLFAAGGAARGISGPGAWGYIAGNGLLSATTLGRLAGAAAARVSREAAA